MNFNISVLLFLIVTVIFSKSTSEDVLTHKRIGRCIEKNLNQDTTVSNLDSLKWMMYSMNYDRRARHYRDDNKSPYDVLECDVVLWRQETNLPDTLISIFSFFRGNPKEIYTPQTIYYIGIGYSYISKSYFPVLSVGSLPFECNLNSCKEFFEKKEKAFLEYLKNYKKGVAPWLRQEALRRGAVIE